MNIQKAKATFFKDTEDRALGIYMGVLYYMVGEETGGEYLSLATSGTPLVLISLSHYCDGMEQFKNMVEAIKFMAGAKEVILE